jgi:hypothetical protein
MLILGENRRRHAGSKWWAQGLVACKRCGYTPYDVQVKRWYRYAGKGVSCWQPHTLHGDLSGLVGGRVELCLCLSCKHWGRVVHTTICRVGITNPVALHTASSDMLILVVAFL